MAYMGCYIGTHMDICTSGGYPRMEKHPQKNMEHGKESRFRIEGLGCAHILGRYNDSYLLGN